MISAFVFAADFLQAAELKWDFEGDEKEPLWVSVNDGVMGGLSKGGAEINDGKLWFSGMLSLENNGGFSSIRTRAYQGDLSEFRGLRLRVKGDGRIYQLRVKTDAKFRRRGRISYSAEFKTVKGEWKVVQIPFLTMKPSWRGRPLKGPDLDTTKISELGILIGDKKAGKFELQIDWIKTIAED